MPCSINALAVLLATQRLSTFDLALVAVYLIGITLFGLRFRKIARTQAAADKFAQNLLPRQQHHPLVGHRALHRLGRNLHAHHHLHPRRRLRRRLRLPAGRHRLHARPHRRRGALPPALLRRRDAHRLPTHRPPLRPLAAQGHRRPLPVTRAAAEGVRVFAVSIVVGIAIGTRDILSIGIISALTLLYTFEGGMAAVVWTDVVQMVIYIGGTFVALFTLGSHVPGGWPEIHTVAAAAGKFHMFNFAFNLTDDLHLLGRRPRRNVPHHGLARHRPAHGPAAARRAQPARIPARPAQLRRRHLPAVHALPAHRRRPLRLLSASIPAQPSAPTTASSPPSSSARCPSASPACSSPRSSPPPCRTSPPRSTHFPPPLSSTSTCASAPTPTTASAASSQSPQPSSGRSSSSPSRLHRAGWRQRPRRRDRPLHRLGRLRLPARRLPARHPHAVRHRTRRHHRHDLRLHSQRSGFGKEHSPCISAPSPSRTSPGPGTSSSERSRPSSSARFASLSSASTRARTRRRRDCAAARCSLLSLSQRMPRSPRTIKRQRKARTTVASSGLHRRLHAHQRRHRRTPAPRRRPPRRPQRPRRLRPRLRRPQARRRTRPRRPAPPAEPMTENTIFDMASLSKDLSTATSIMQLYEQGKLTLRRARRANSSPTSIRTTTRARQSHRAHAAHAHLRRARRCEPQRSLGPRDTRQGRRHPPRAHHTAAVRSRRGLPLLRHQLHPARRHRRNALRRAARTSTRRSTSSNRSA